MNDEISKTALLLGLSLKQNQRIFEAVPYWNIAAKLDNPYAYIELAKLYEHIHKEYHPALVYSESAKSIITEKFPREHSIHLEIEHRIARLNRLILEESSQTPQ